MQRRNGERAGTGVDYDELSNYSDPKRIGVYFSKHGLFADKEYQNQVPALWRATEGGARFWGYWALETMIVSREVNEAVLTGIIRHLRALADRNSYSRTVVTKWVREEREITSLDFALDPETGEVTEECTSHWVPKYRPEPRGSWKYLPAWQLGKRLEEAGWALDPADPSRIRRFRARPVHRRVKRWRNVVGFEVVNDSMQYLPDIARIIAAQLDELSDREGYDVRLLAALDDERPDWFGSEPPQWGQTTAPA